MLSRRGKCDATLMKKVKVGGKQKCIPHKLYMYNSIVHTLQRFIKRPGFIMKCEEWRNRSNLTDMHGDI